MVLPIKVFKISRDVHPESLIQELKDFHEGEPYQTEGGAGELESEILDLRTKNDLISGVFSRDFISKATRQCAIFMVPMSV